MEKLRSGAAGGTAIVLLGLLLHYLPHIHYPLLMLSSIAASAVLLFAAPHSPMAQPWNLIVGHLISAIAGWFCGSAVSDPVLAGAIAVGSSILLMHLLNCLHPPGAATALTMVLSSTLYHDMGLLWAIYIVAANAGLSLILALLINNLLPGRQYPAGHPATGLHPQIAADIEIGVNDIEWALSKIDSVIDVSEEDLIDIYRLAREHARQQKKMLSH
ncbi:MAG TPA: HPP family protein [Gallionella sp.]|nr:HPP family protein [Gallionella sp.]